MRHPVERMALILPVADSPSASLLDDAAHCLDEGGVLAVGTESFYALAARTDCEPALQKVVAMKGERAGKPLLALIGDLDHLALLTPPPSPHAHLLIARFWPGPLTLVLPALPHVSHTLTAGTGTVGVRQPGEPKLLALLQRTGPVTGTSANRAGAPPLRTAKDVEREFGREVDLILDTGTAPGGRPSTVLDLVGAPRILRPGAVSPETIDAVLAEAESRLAEE